MNKMRQERAYEFLVKEIMNDLALSDELNGPVAVLANVDKQFEFEAANTLGVNVGLNRSEFAWEKQDKSESEREIINDYLAYVFTIGFNSPEALAARQAMVKMRADSLKKSYDALNKDRAQGSEAVMAVRTIDYQPDKKTIVSDYVKMYMGKIGSLGYGSDFYKTTQGREILRMEWQAILTARNEGASIEVIYPMVSDTATAEDNKTILQEAVRRAGDILGTGKTDAEKDAINKNLNAAPVKFMIETPEAVRNIKQLLGRTEISGISIGTNDLSKYLLEEKNNSLKSKDGVYDKDEEMSSRDDAENKKYFSEVNKDIASNVNTILYETALANLKRISLGEKPLTVTVCGEMASWPSFQFWINARIWHISQDIEQIAEDEYKMKSVDMRKILPVGLSMSNASVSSTIVFMNKFLDKSLFDSDQYLDDDSSFSLARRLEKRIQEIMEGVYAGNAFSKHYEKVMNEEKRGNSAEFATKARSMTKEEMAKPNSGRTRNALLAIMGGEANVVPGLDLSVLTKDRRAGFFGLQGMVGVAVIAGAAIIGMTKFSLTEFWFYGGIVMAVVSVGLIIASMIRNYPKAKPVEKNDHENLMPNPAYNERGAGHDNGVKEIAMPEEGIKTPTPEVSAAYRNLVKKVMNVLERNASIVIGVVNDGNKYTQDQLDDMQDSEELSGQLVGIRLVAIKGETPEERMKDLEIKRLEIGAWGAGILETSNQDEDTFKQSVVGIAKALYDKDAEDFMADFRRDPVSVSLTEEANVNILQGLMTRLAERLIPTTSLALAEMSAYEIEINARHNKIIGQTEEEFEKTGTTLSNILSSDKVERYGVVVENIAEIKILADTLKKQNLSKDLYTKLTVVVKADSDKLESVKEAVAKYLELEDAAITVVARTEWDGMSVAEKVEKVKDGKDIPVSRIALGEQVTSIETISAEDKAYLTEENKDKPVYIAMPLAENGARRGLASHLVLAMAAVVSGQETLTNALGITSQNGWYLFMPAIDRVDMQKLVDLMAAYQEVAVRA
ncbi:MAG: hypothetical protein HQL29_06105 [Candidatus Omnitrophica bacterium]|nr:hypothetical protein [Candidatus Omnitrophota bacterium]